MKIPDLLKQEKFDRAWVQGYHTRLVTYYGKTFGVIRENNAGMFTEFVYSGDNEKEAIEAFIFSEKKGFDPK